MSVKKGNKGSLVAERTLQTLMLFTKKRYVSVHDVSEELEISLTASYRLMDTLEETDFIRKNDTRMYELCSPNILQLYNMLDHDIRLHARPIIKMLANTFNESIYLSVSFDNKPYYSFIEKEDSPLNVKWSEHLGKTYELPAGTAGKTHLAYILNDLSETEKNEALSKVTLKKYTEKSVDSVDKLKYSLNNIIEQGYCYTNSEHKEGVVGISVPVFNNKFEKVIAVLSVFMPKGHFDKKDLSNYVQLLKDGSQKISISVP